jgi:hypothetical protein
MTFEVQLTGKKIASQILDSGYGFIAAAAITGRTSEESTIEEVADIKKFPKNAVYEQKVLDIYNDILQKLNSGKVLTISTRSKPEDSSKRNVFKHKSGESKADVGIYSEHVYSIIENVREENGYKYIEVRNPHFAEGSTYGNKVSSGGSIKKGRVRQKDFSGIIDESSGKIDFELNDFIKYFDSYTVAEVRPKSQP